MGSFKLGKMTLGGLFKQPETIQYPVQTKTPPPGLKGHVANDVANCILCGICQKRCPCRRHHGGQARPHVDHRPLPLRAVRQLRARVPEGLPDDGAFVCSAGGQKHVDAFEVPDTKKTA